MRSYRCCTSLPYLSVGSPYPFQGEPTDWSCDQDFIICKAVNELFNKVNKLFSVT